MLTFTLKYHIRSYMFRSTWTILRDTPQPETYYVATTLQNLYRCTFTD